MGRAHGAHPERRAEHLPRDLLLEQRQPSSSGCTSALPAPGFSSAARTTPERSGAGTTLQLSAVGSTISFLQNGVRRITATDTSLTGGAPGIMTYGKAKADNWVGGGATGSSGSTYSVGGSTSGLSGTVVLRNNGGDDLTLTANGPFNFATKLASAPPTPSPSRRTRAARAAASPTAAARSAPPTSRTWPSAAPPTRPTRSAAAPPGSPGRSCSATTAATI